MQEENAPLSFSIVNTIKDIPEKEWAELFDSDIIEGYGYHKTIEESRLKEFTLRYLIGRRAKTAVSIMPFFLLSFSFEQLISPFLKGIVRTIQKVFPRFLIFRLIFLGAPATEEFYMGAGSNENIGPLIDGAWEKLKEYGKDRGVLAVVFNNLSRKNRALIDHLEKRGFIKMETLPNTRITLNASSVEEYILSLSKNTRKDLKRKLRRSRERAQLKIEARDAIAGISEQAYALYRHNLNNATVGFEILTPEFFLNISKNMPGCVKFFITYAKNKIVAFNLCLIKGDTCIDKYVGFDPEVAYDYYLYFVTFFHNIQWCLENKIRYYQMGVSDYFPKVRLGAKLIPLDIYSKGFNPFLNLLFRCIAPFIQPKNMDPSLKKVLSLDKGNR